MNETLLVPLVVLNRKKLILHNVHQKFLFLIICGFKSYANYQYIQSYNIRAKSCFYRIEHQYQLVVGFC